jgi:hypothetical protein
MLLFHDARRRLQLRVSARVSRCEEEPRRAAAWGMLSPAARRLYAAGPAPGSPIGEAQALALRAFTAADADAADASGVEAARPPGGDAADGTPVDGGPGTQATPFSRFVLLDCAVEAIDRLELGRDGQLRSRHLREADGWRHEWIAP